MTIIWLSIYNVCQLVTIIQLVEVQFTNFGYVCETNGGTMRSLSRTSTGRVKTSPYPWHCWQDKHGSKSSDVYDDNVAALHHKASSQCRPKPFVMPNYHVGDCVDKQVLDTNIEYQHSRRRICLSTTLCAYAKDSYQGHKQKHKKPSNSHALGSKAFGAVCQYFVC